jgi:ABC-type nickel/cobalt efflux system permease component RcnA
MEPLAVIALGFVLGVRHATDPDHVVAVTAIAARSRRIAPAALVGVLWGLGHSLTILLVGGAIVLFNLVVPPRVGLAFEFAVGLALAIVGAINLFGRPKPHDDGPAAVPTGRAFGLGLVHGLAGSAAVALLVLAAVQDARTGLVYLAVFSLGTILGMVGITVGLAAPLKIVGARWPGYGVPLRVVTGTLSLLFGMYVLWHVGWIDGLFSAKPTWSPR